MKPLGPGDPIRLGPYRVIGVLGEGGMGKVYFGRDHTGATAAVKVLLPELAHDQNLVQRFLREAHTARAVTGAGVARVLGAESEGNRPWIATEFLSGPTLDEAVRAYGPFDASGVRALAASLADTLRDIHAAGLVHRDLKPANIVLTATGPRVIDFGIARPEHGLTLTTTGQVPVTPGYGAPEQVLGQRVGPAADVFSLGAVLVYAATGQRAFDGTHVAAVQYEVVHGEARLSTVPDELRALIAPCLAKDPGPRPTPERIAGAFAPPRGADRAWRKGPLADDIARRRAEAERQAAPEGATVTDGPSRRRFLRTSIGAGGLLAVSGGAAGVWWSTREETPKGPPRNGIAHRAALLDRPAKVPGRAPKPLWGPLPVAAEQADGAPTTPLSLVDVVMFAGRDGGLVAHLARTGEEKWRLPDIAPGAGLLAMTERLFLAADAGGALRVHNASTGASEWSLPAAEVTRLLAFDGEAVYVVTQDNRLRAIDTGLRTVRWTVPLPTLALLGSGPKAAAARNKLVLSGANGNAWAFECFQGAVIWEAKGRAGSAVEPLIVTHKRPETITESVFLGGPTLTVRDLVGGRGTWSDAAAAAPVDGAGGWGPPVSDGDAVIGVKDDTLVRLDSERMLVLGYGSVGPGPLPHVRPVIQGRTVWVVLAEGKGVAAHSTADGTRFWSWSTNSRGPWAMSGAENRVFLVNDGKITAMPSVG
ncbi:protein kinase domain-containing protein [Streptomyces sp. H27-H5]|uniref:serine/threonine-protein kinase n=1 Tax=Streptomyces sp. H27-H5 TaxID=2996460 RepID=UPI0022715538|nr:protein kinase [Streptomyces sp. H27-H5]MCY0962690.1 protein kinase [Streptomyces sp. H27-H5]